ncbi:MAG: hypothetical protein ACI4UU_04390 [Clostridia bacterium]
MKKVAKYIITFLIVLIALILILVLSAKIKKEYIIENIVESANYLEKKPGIEKVQNKREYTYLHTYADSVILNIIFCTDSSDCFKSVIESKFYQTLEIDSNTDFVNAVKNNEEGNTEYARYWHGSTAIIRPLLIFFNIQQIYIILAVLLIIIYILFIYNIFKKSKSIAVITAISTIMINIFITPFCLEYIWTIIIMLITSIIAIKKEKNGNEVLYYMFFIVGILTCYFDFLSTETLTLTIPLILVILIRHKENRIEKLKECSKFILRAIAIWLVGYSAMWISKWILSAIMLDSSLLETIKTKMFIRINGDIQNVSTLNMYLGAITKNIYALFPINIVKRKWEFVIPIIVIIILLVYLIDKKKIKRNWYIKVLVVISIIPYLRYILLSNHSYKHYFFTFRAQMVTIIGILCIILELIDKQKIKKIWRFLKKDIKIKGEKEK